MRLWLWGGQGGRVRTVGTDGGEVGALGDPREDVPVRGEVIVNFDGEFPGLEKGFDYVD